MSTKKIPPVHVRRYEPGEDDIYSGVIEPEDESWALFIRKDGYPELWLQVEGYEDEKGTNPVKGLMPALVVEITGYAEEKGRPPELVQMVRHFVDAYVNEKADELAETPEERCPNNPPDPEEFAQRGFALRVKEKGTTETL